MQLNFLEQLGDWNPQLLREIKGRLKPRSIMIAIGISLLGQFLLFQSFQSQLPVNVEKNYSIYNRFCTGPMAQYSEPLCIKGIDGNFQLNLLSWWQNLFVTFSLIGIFVLLVAGTYMLINDLAQEERRGTLNFIRLSPQSSQSILIGKILGTPILLYLVALIGVPLHLWAAISAQIPLPLIGGFYLVGIASCMFFYSASLLFGLFGAGFSGFQPWLGSGAVLMFLWMDIFKPIMQSVADWLTLFSPSMLFPYLIDTELNKYDLSFLKYMKMESLQWFYLPLGENGLGIIILALANYALWTYWIWQGLKRRFHNPSQTMLSKGQSYALVACFEVVNLGFALQTPRNIYYNLKNQMFENLVLLAIFNLFLFFGLIAILSPHRQVLQDWARYRREKVADSKRFWNRSLIKDLIWGEKSHALVAIALNLVIITTILVPWILVSPIDNLDKSKALIGVAFFLSLMMIYASVAQLMLMMKTSKRSLWVALTMGGMICLPSIILGVLGLTPDKSPNLWLFSTFPWMGIEKGEAITVLLSIVAQLSIITLLNLQLNRQLKQAGESASKAILAGRNSLPIG